MNFFKRIQLKIRNYNRDRIASKNKDILREFVYLDEVSVFSLLASRLGTIATDFTNTESFSLQQEGSGNAGLSTPGVSGEASFSINREKTNSTQIVRKSIIQTHFRDLFNYEKEKFKLRDPQNESLPITYTDINSQVTDSKWIINTGEISRGDLIELEIKLETEYLFKFNTIISSLIEMYQEYTDKGFSFYSHEMSQFQFANELINNFLIGLIPIRGEAINYKVVKLDQNEYIVHNKVLDQLPMKKGIEILPLIVVGVTDKNLYWKDIRQLLFSKTNYFVLCRIISNSLLDSWKSVKLLHLFESILPNEASQFTEIISKLENQSIMNQNAYKNYHLYNQFYESIIDKFTLNNDEDIKQKILSGCNKSKNYRDIKWNLEYIQSEISTHFSVQFDNSYAIKSRQDYLEYYLESQNNDNQNDSYKDIDKTDKLQERYIETEFIGIYW